MERNVPLLSYTLRPTQSPHEVVDIAGWRTNEDFEVYPVGSKPKRLVVAPVGVAPPFIVGSHNYLFKVAADFKQHQLWSEIIAYDLSRACGVEVPPCFVAVDGRRAECGVLMEFFFGYPGLVSPRFVHGTDANRAFYPDYDEMAGRPHQVLRNVKICRTLGISGAVEWWGRTVTFDALIGNVDRHAENWGLLRDASQAPAKGWSLAPAFDNGTSLGYECAEPDLDDSCRPERLSRYLKRGRHHSTLREDIGRRGDPFFTLCAEFYAAYPVARQAMESVILVTDEQIAASCHRCVQFDVPVKFGEKRAHYVETLIRERRNALIRAFGL